MQWWCLCPGCHPRPYHDVGGEPSFPFSGTRWQWWWWLCSGGACAPVATPVPTMTWAGNRVFSFRAQGGSGGGGCAVVVLVPRLPPPSVPGRGQGTEFSLFGHKVVVVVVVAVVQWWCLCPGCHPRPYHDVGGEPSFPFSGTRWQWWWWWWWLCSGGASRWWWWWWWWCFHMLSVLGIGH